MCSRRGRAARGTAPSRPAAGRGSRRRRRAGSSRSAPRARQLEVLVEQPAVHQQVEGVVGRAAPATVSRIVVPAALRTRRARPSAGLDASRSAPSSARASRASRPWPSRNDESPRLARARGRRSTCSAAQGSSPAPKRLGQRLAAQRRPAAPASRCGRGTPVRSPVAERSGVAGVREGDAAGELLVVGVAREARAPSPRRARSPRAGAVPGRRRAEDPLVVGEDAAAGAAARRGSSSVSTENFTGSARPRRPSSSCRDALAARARSA